MPSELLHLPPSYTLVGLYRLVTDPSIRSPVLDKIKHASIRGLVVGVVYAAVSWRTIDWFIRAFLVEGSGSRLGWLGLGKKVEKVLDGASAGGAGTGSGGGTVRVAGVEMDLVFCECSSGLAISSGLLLGGLAAYSSFLFLKLGLTIAIIYPGKEITQLTTSELNVCSR